MPEQPQPRPQLRGNQCNMTDIMRRISLSKPHVDLGMYRTLYTIDYQPYGEHPWHPIMEPSEKLKLEAKLKEKEFAKPVQKKPVKYYDEPSCHEINPPYPVGMAGRAPKGQEAPPQVQQVEEEQWNRSPTFADLTTLHQKEAQSLAQPADAVALTGYADAPCIKQEQGQNWNTYQQFLLENRRANQAQANDIRRLNYETSVFPRDYTSGTDGSTYQRDYKRWPRLHSGYCRAHRNFSNVFSENNYCKEKHWSSEYADNYSIFLRKLHWQSRNPVSSFCSAVKPIPHLTHGMPSQTPIAVNTAL